MGECEMNQKKKHKETHQNVFRKTKSFIELTILYCIVCRLMDLPWILKLLTIFSSILFHLHHSTAYKMKKKWDWIPVASTNEAYNSVDVILSTKIVDFKAKKK